MYCPNCDSEVESTVRTISETYPVKGEEVTIDAHVRFCKHCGCDIWDDKLDAQNLQDAFSAYRAKHQLLQPSDIRMIREKYSLSQIAFARVLGLGDKTIARYESGSIADAAQNNLIELIQHPENFLELLEKNKSKISAQDYDSAIAALDELRPKILYKAQDNIYTTLHYSTVPDFWGSLRYA